MSMYTQWSVGSTILRSFTYLWAIPCDVMWGKLSVSTLLQYLSNTLKVTDKVDLSCAFGATLVVAVGPELILHTLIWVGKWLSPVKVDAHHLISKQSRLQFVTKVLCYKSWWDCDVLQKECGGRILLRRIHGDEILLLVVSHQHPSSSRQLRIPYLVCKVTVCRTPLC